MICLIELTQGMQAMVDAEDLNIVKPYSWYAAKSDCTWYAQTNVGSGGQRKSFRMQWLILPARQGYIIDHVDRNGLNNRRLNLRYADSCGNAANRIRNVTKTSRFIGVSWNSRRGSPWHAQIQSKSAGKIHIGFFDSELEAAAARDAIARTIFGEFAILNFPKEISNERTT